MMRSLEQRVAAIEERNRRVEADKAWETSWTRHLLLAGLTYVVAFIYLRALDVADPALNAFEPALGVLLSTLAFGSIKRYWIKRRRQDAR